MLELMSAHGFETLKLNRICLHVFSSNKRVRRSCEKAGFVVKETLRQAMFRRGHYRDVILMSILQSECKKRREAS